MPRGVPRSRSEGARARRAQSPGHYIEYLCLAVDTKHEVRNRQKARPEFIAHCKRLYEEQRGRCALSGAALTHEGLPCTPTQVSIDRIDSGRGYVAGNVRLVAVWVNRALSHWGDATLQSFVAEIYHHRRVRQEPRTPPFALEIR